jgi:hypothetical protein
MDCLYLIRVDDCGETYNNRIYNNKEYALKVAPKVKTIAIEQYKYNNMKRAYILYSTHYRVGPNLFREVME